MTKVSFSLPGGIELDEPASLEQVTRLEAALAGKLCPVHREFLLLSNGAYHEADGVDFLDDIVIFDTASIQEMQPSYNVDKYAPGFYVIGVDSGSRVALLRLGGHPSPVYSAGAGDMRPANFLTEAPSLAEWLTQRVRFQMNDED